MSGDLRKRDEGTILPMVLVWMAIGALITLPMLAYASTVLRANTVLSQKNIHGEAGKAGFRMAMADPYDLYDL